MSKDKKAGSSGRSETPKCPICGRRSTVRRLDERMHYCDHCRQAFNS